MKPETIAPERLLEIRTVEIVSGAGRSVTVSSVRCPVRGGEVVPLEECACCGRGAGVAADALARGGWLRCGAAPGADGVGPRVRDALAPAAVALRTAVPRAVAAEALRAHRQGSAPVVDGEGRPVGFVTEAALLRARAGARVGDAMARVAVAVSEAAPLSRAAAVMAEHRVDRVAVVGADGGLVGVLSALDVIAWAASADGRLSSPASCGLRGR